MGQPITVVERRSHQPGVVRFEINRPLTGMGHERYVAGQVIDGVRPVDELARRLFARGGIDAVHANGSVVTIELARGGTSDGLAEVIEGLFTYYVASIEAPAAAAEAPSPETEPAAAVEAQGHAEVAAEPAEVTSEEPEDAPAPQPAP